MQFHLSGSKKFSSTAASQVCSSIFNYTFHQHQKKQHNRSKDSDTHDAVQLKEHFTYFYEFIKQNKPNTQNNNDVHNKEEKHFQPTCTQGHIPTLQKFFTLLTSKYIFNNRPFKFFTSTNKNKISQWNFNEFKVIIIR